MGILYKRPVYAPKLTSSHHQARVEFAKQMLLKQQEDANFVGKVLFTDETYISEETHRQYLRHVVSRSNEDHPLVNKSQGTTKKSRKTV